MGEKGGARHSSHHQRAFAPSTQYGSAKPTEKTMCAGMALSGKGFRISKSMLSPDGCPAERGGGPWA